MSAADRREQILDVTSALVSVHGFSTLSIEAVAREAGISRPIVYGHFGDLAGLLDAVVDREMTRALAQVSETQVDDLTGGSPILLLLDSLRAFLHAVRDHPSTWRLVLLAPEGAPAAMRARVAAGRERVLRQLTRAVRPVVDEGGLARDAELTAHLLSAIADEYARLVLADPESYPPERLLEHARLFLERVMSPRRGASAS